MSVWNFWSPQAQGYFMLTCQLFSRGFNQDSREKLRAGSWLSVLYDKHETWALPHNLLSQEAKVLNCRKRSRNYACHQGPAKIPCFWKRVVAKTLCSWGSGGKPSWVKDCTLIQNKDLLPFQEGQESISAQDLSSDTRQRLLLQGGEAGTLKKPYLQEACLRLRLDQNPICPHYESSSRKQGAAVSCCRWGRHLKREPPCGKHLQKQLKASGWSQNTQNPWLEEFEDYGAEQNWNPAQFMTIMEMNIPIQCKISRYAKKVGKNPNLLSRKKVFKRTRLWDEWDVWSRQEL